jgi:AsmA protein
VATPQGQGGEDLDKLVGIPIPVHLTGALSRPNWSIDLAEALTASQKVQLEQRLDAEIRKQVPKELQDKLPKLPQKLLEGLFH